MTTSISSKVLVRKNIQKTESLKKRDKKGKRNYGMYNGQSDYKKVKIRNISKKGAKPPFSFIVYVYLYLHIQRFF